MDNDGPPEEVATETTSAFRDDFLGELDAAAPASAEGPMWDVEDLPSGSALLIVTRGPNAGSRFLLDQPVTSAGRHPDSSIFLDDITVSRRHAESSGSKANSASSMSAASTAPMSTGNRWIRRCWSMVMRSRSASSVWPS